MSARRLLPALLAVLLSACGEPARITPPAMALSATELSFSGVSSDPDPPAQTVTISNPGGGALGAPLAQVVYRSGVGWLDGAAVSLAGAEAPYTLTVRPRVGGLTKGTYEATVVLGAVSAANSPQSLAVTLEVESPEMTLSATTLTFSGAAGEAAPAAQELAVANTGAGSLAAPTVSVTYGSGAGWLTTTVLGASAPYTVRVQASTAALAAGTYGATLRVASRGATRSPQDVAVTLQVAPRMVVTRLLTSWGEDGTGRSAAPGDVTAVALLQGDCAGGTAPIDLAPGASAGTWTGQPPTGPWCARVTWADGRLGYYRGSGLFLDLGEDQGGRADRQAATLATDVTLDLGGLDPWSGFNDSIVLFSWGAQARGFLDDFTPGWPLIDGDEILLAFPFDWLAVVGPLLTAADGLYLVQLRLVQEFINTTKTKSVAFQRAMAWTTATGLAMADGQPLALAPPALPAMTSLVTVVNGSLALNWQRSAFEAAVPPFTPTGAFTGHQVGVYATPAPLTATAPLGALAMPLLLCTDPDQALTGGSDFDGGVRRYARFLPARYQDYLHARYGKLLVRRAPGATSGLPEAQDLVYRYDAMAAAPATIQPLVGAVTSPTIDGQGALAGTGLTGVALAPTLAWLPPATGTPTSYRVEILRLAASGTATVGTPIAELVVDGATRTLKLPAGLLQAGATYLARLAARSSPTDAGGLTPLRAAVPFGEGVLWTVTFATAP